MIKPELICDMSWEFCILMIFFIINSEDVGVTIPAFWLSYFAQDSKATIAIVVMQGALSLSIIAAAQRS